MCNYFCYVPVINKYMILFFFFRILGLCNNFGYVVMLTAAYDILGKKGTNTVLVSKLHSALQHETCTIIL